MTEFFMAYHHNVALKRKKRLIVLLMLDSLNDLDVRDVDCDTAVLRQYLRQYTYIKYPADNWLDRLLYALPLRGLGPPQDTDDDVELLENIR